MRGREGGGGGGQERRRNKRRREEEVEKDWLSRAVIAPSLKDISPPVICTYIHTLYVNHTSCIYVCNILLHYT